MLIFRDRATDNITPFVLCSPQKYTYAAEHRPGKLGGVLFTSVLSPARRGGLLCNRRTTCSGAGGSSVADQDNSVSSLKGGFPDWHLALQAALKETDLEK